MELNHNMYIAAMLKDVGPMLNQIYKFYFPQELIKSSRDLEKQTESSIHHFNRDFGIFPGLASKSQIQHVYLYTKSFHGVTY